MERALPEMQSQGCLHPTPCGTHCWTLDGAPAGVGEGPGAGQSGARAGARTAEAPSGPR